jgi:hypothetical protein
MRCASTALCVAILAGLPAACQTSEPLSASWTDPSGRPAALNRTVVLVLDTTPGERAKEENELSALFKGGTAAHTVVPESDLSDREKVKQRIIGSGADGALVIRTDAESGMTTYVPGTRSYWQGTDYSAYRHNVGQKVTEKVVRVEVSLYAVPTGKLLWYGAGNAESVQDLEAFRRQTARKSIETLREKGFVR